MGGRTLVGSCQAHSSWVGAYHGHRRTLCFMGKILSTYSVSLGYLLCDGVAGCCFLSLPEGIAEHMACCHSTICAMGCLFSKFVREQGCAFQWQSSGFPCRL